ncbi:MAG: hypothetical protein FWF15_09455 [Oscillospiraceae bacterium]|nr:hypothetical protein [Oscillospiraceae bacterium]
MKKRFVLFILVLLFIVSCGVTSENKPDTQKSGDTTVPETEGPYSVLPNVRLDGREFTILYPTYIENVLHLVSEVQDGETINDSVYTRNLEIEERYDIIIKKRSGNNDPSKDISKIVLSGDDLIDLAVVHPRLGVSTLLTEDLLYNWFDLEYIDFSKPCWNQDIQRSFLIGNKLCYAAGDLTIDWAGGLLMLFNKDMTIDLGLESPYKYVLNGTWTIDRLMEFIKGTWQDLNGDGKMDKNDICGYVNNECEYSFIHASGMKITEPDADGRQVLSIFGERLATLADKMLSLLHGPDSFLPGYADAMKMFSNNQALIALIAFVEWTQFRAIEFDFGIVPVPKLYENQENFYNMSGVGLLGVPKNVKDPENTSIIIQAIMEGSYRYLRPAYIDVVLYNKCLRDEESQKSVEIIINSTVYDFGYTFGVEDASKRMEQIITATVTNKKSLDLASYYEKNAEIAQASYDKIYEYCTQ